MGLAELVLLAVGLSMDAFAVSICKGLGMKKINLKVAVVLGLFFGGFRSDGNQCRDIYGWKDWMSSSWIFSRARFLEVACLDLEAFAEKREIKSCSSLIFSSFFLLASFI